MTALMAAVAHAIRGRIDLAAPANQIANLKKADTVACDSVFSMCKRS
jgi:hypothetical protein